MLKNCVAQVKIHWVGLPQTILNKILLLLSTAATKATLFYGQFLTFRQENN
jgi:hypothetical protein